MIEFSIDLKTNTLLILRFHSELTTNTTHTYALINKKWIPLIAARDRKKERKTCLGYWKSGSKIDEKIGLQISNGDLMGVHDELTPPENLRRRRNKGCSELHDHVEEVEEIGDGAKKCDENGQAVVCGETTRAADEREIKVEGVYEKGYKATYKKDLVPMSNNIAVWC